MLGLPWTQNMALAPDDLDEEHRGLLNKLNRLLAAISAEDKTGLMMAFSTLQVASQEHFATEEAQMLDLSYPDREKHCESHRRLLEGLSELRYTLSATERFASTMGPHVFLERWFVAHLANDDKKLAEFLAQRARQAPIAAR